MYYIVCSTRCPGCSFQSLAYSGEFHHDASGKGGQASELVSLLAGSRLLGSSGTGEAGLGRQTRDKAKYYV